MNSIFHRVSIRKYQEKKIEQEKVEQLLRAAMAAPSACNQQPCGAGSSISIIQSKSKRAGKVKSLLDFPHPAPYNKPIFFIKSKLQNMLT